MAYPWGKWERKAWAVLCNSVEVEATEFYSIEEAKVYIYLEELMPLKWWAFPARVYKVNFDRVTFQN